jgi:DNA-binding GntR family transcriptional regulator
VKEIPADRESLADQVYESIRDAIILGELIPGSLHSMYHFAAELHVSRTPVREALIKLADQGMVRFERNRGIRILLTTIHDLEEIFSLRLLLEVPATFRATDQFVASDRRQLRQALDALNELRPEDPKSSARDHLECDARFHRVIMKASGNQRLANFIDTLRDLQQVRGASTVGVTRDFQDVYQDHLDIYERITAGDAAGAAAAMKNHIALTARLLLAQEAGDVGSAPRFDLSWLDMFTANNVSAPQAPPRL